jgi:molybdopterin-guanine dinucleotide biosynthesis protein A
VIRHPGITGVILAGGRATRMGGRNKALLPSGAEAGSRTILERTLAIFAGRLAGCVLVLSRDAEPEAYLGLPVSIAYDRYDALGPLSGIESGLGAVRTPWAFVCACDMPRISADLIDAMAQRAREGRALVPMRGDRPEPLHALYPAGCAAEARACLEEGVRTIRDFLMRIQVDYLDAAAWSGIPGAERSFDNLNTQDELERYWREARVGEG